MAMNGIVSFSLCAQLHAVQLYFCDACSCEVAVLIIGCAC